MAKLPNYYKVSVDGLTVKLDPIYEEMVEVVRCKDCKYFSRDEEHNRAWCNYYTGCIETAVNGYCYHGARMNKEA